MPSGNFKTVDRVCVFMCLVCVSERGGWKLKIGSCKLRLEAVDKKINRGIKRHKGGGGAEKKREKYKRALLADIENAAN